MDRQDDNDSVKGDDYARCSALGADGKQCRMPAKAGTELCHIHLRRQQQRENGSSDDGRQCEATLTNGGRCGMWAIRGTNRCVAHSTPLERAKAKQHLYKMVPAALAALEEAMAKADWPTVVKAATAILDRAGFGAKSTVTVDDKRFDYSKLTDEELMLRAQSLTALLRDQVSVGMNDDDVNSVATDSHVH